MAVSSEDLKIKVVIDTDSNGLSGITHVGEELSSVGKSGASAIDRISAAVSNLKSQEASLASAGDGLKSVTSNASATESSLHSLGQELFQVHSQFKNLQSGTEAFDALKQKSRELQAQIQQLKGTTAEVVSPAAITNTKALNSAFIDIGRVFADMPYGIQGIANNLEQLPGSMGRLRAEAEATGQSMTSMLLRGAMSPAGAGVAVAAITAMWVAWDMYGAKAMAAMNSSGQSAQELEQRLDGVSKYENIDIKIAMIGVEGAKRDLLVLLNLQERLANMNKENGLTSKLAEAKKATSEASFGPMSILSGNTSKDLKKASDAILEVGRVQAEIAEHTLITNQKIWSGNLSYEYDENKRRLMAAGYDEKEVVSRLKLLAVQSQVNEADAKYQASKAKEAEALDKKNLASAKSAVSATVPAKYTAEWNAYQTAIKSATDYLKKQNMATISLGEAERVAADAKASLIAATKEASKGGADYERVARNITEAQKAAASADDLVKAKKREYTAALKEEEGQTIRVSKLLNTYTDNTLPVAEALDSLKVAHEAVVVAQAKGADGSLEFIKAQENERKAIDAATASLAKQKAVGEQWAQTASYIGDAFATMTGTTIKGLSSIENGLKLIAQKGTDSATGLSNSLTGALKLAGGIGQSIGGGVGSAISGAASGALAGSSLATALSSILGFGGPTGAIIGGAVGLISSFFGGKTAEDLQNQQNAQSASTNNANTISQLAAAGSAIAMKIMATAGYKTSNLAGNLYGTGTPTSAFTGIGIDPYLKGNIQELALFYTKEKGYNADLVTYIQNLQQIDNSLKSMSSPAIVATIAQIGYKYDAMIATMTTTTTGMFGQVVSTAGPSLEQLADVAKAKMNDLIVAVTGISVNTVGADIASAFASYSGFSDAGTAAASKIKDEMVSAIQQMTISNVLLPQIAAMLQPVLADITTKLISGVALTPGDLAGIKSAITTVTSSMVPLINNLYDTFTATGLLTSAQEAASATTSALTGSVAGSTTSLAALQSQYDQLTMTTIEMRKKELAILNPTTAAMQSLVWSLQDTKTAADAAVAAQKAEADQNYSLTTQLLQLQGNTAEIRARELALITSQANQELQKQIWSLEDTKTAADAAAAVSSASASMSTAAESATALAEALKTKLTAALGILSDAVSRQKETNQTAFDSASKVINDSLSLVGDSISKLASLNQDLQSSLDSMSVQSNPLDAYKSAQKDIFESLAVARSTGKLPLDGALKSALATVSQDSTAQFGSQLEYQRDFYKTVSAITALKALTVGTLTDTQQSQSILQSQLEILTDGFNAEQKWLNDILKKGQEQVDVALGTTVAVMSVTDAVDNLSRALGTQIGNETTATTTGGNFFYRALAATPSPTLSESKNTEDLSVLISELIDVTQQGNAAIAINTRDVALILDWWKHNGMPATEAA